MPYGIFPASITTLKKMLPLFFVFVSLDVALTIFSDEEAGKISLLIVYAISPILMSYYATKSYFRIDNLYRFNATNFMYFFHCHALMFIILMVLLVPVIWVLYNIGSVPLDEPSVSTLSGVGLLVVLWPAVFSAIGSMAPETVFRQERAFAAAFRRFPRYFLHSFWRLLLVLVVSLIGIFALALVISELPIIAGYEGEGSIPKVVEIAVSVPGALIAGIANIFGSVIIARSYLLAEGRMEPGGPVPHVATEPKITP